MRTIRKGDVRLQEADRLNITITGQTANDASKNLGKTYTANKDVIRTAQGHGKDVDLVWQNPNASRSSANGGSNTMAQAVPTQGDGIASAENALRDAAADTDNKQNVSVDASDIQSEGKIVFTKSELNEFLVRLRK